VTANVTANTANTRSVSDHRADTANTAHAPLYRARCVRGRSCAVPSARIRSRSPLKEQP